MTYFSEDYLNFFKELAANNHKDWFDENRNRYHKNVKEPFDTFIRDVIKMVNKHDKNVEIEPKDAIFRINRDIRFSKDKTPYKINRSAIISEKGRKDKAFPGLYLEMGPEHFRIYGGVYMPDKEQLLSIRERLVKKQSHFEKLIADKDFVSTFGELRGEENKIVRDFKEEVTKFPLILKKQFYWFKEFNPELILKENLMEVTEKAYLAQKPVMDFFIQSI